MHEYSQADLTRLFGLSPTLLRGLAAAGYVTPASSDRNTNYTFQDLLIMRMASALKAAKISTVKIVAALGVIRQTLPPGAVLTSLALAAAGKNVVVREGVQEWEASTGQFALPLNSGALPARVSRIKRKPQGDPVAEADAHYARGHELEGSDLTAARDAYLMALNVHRDHLEARVNLGRLLHLDGNLKEAEKVYRQARHSSALLSFNLAILLEDLSREEEAAESYREALAQDPLLHDAHYNLSQLHERAKRPREALRHLLAYRRHLARYGE